MPCHESAARRLPILRMSLAIAAVVLALMNGSVRHLADAGATEILELLHSWAAPLQLHEASITLTPGR
jgi:hypothetical protein